MAHQPSQSDRAPNEGLTARAEAALTHPATLIALATLLVNDLVFKWLWPGYWLTGKLSDLAWVVFAPPLLALLLTFLARRDSTAQKAVWVIAYIGLPLLYAAYNTFEPLHDVIIGGFSVIRGTPGGSPFDPTDSIVIPFGVAIAIWVWRAPMVNSVATRMRIGVLVAVIAAVASVASSYIPRTGVAEIGLGANGTIIADDLQGESEWDKGLFVSLDGGFTWTTADHDDFPNVSWGESSIDTPRGRYAIGGDDVRRVDEGRDEIVYSPSVESRIRHIRIIRAATWHFGQGRWFRTVPYAIHYDDRSGNIVVAMGIQGVVVGTSDGEWHQVPVSDYQPIDYSPTGAISRLNSHTIWMMAIALSLAFVTYSSVVALYWSRVGRGKVVSWSLGAIFGVAPFSMLIMSLIWAFTVAIFVDSSFLEDVQWLKESAHIAIMAVPLGALLVGATFAFANKSNDHWHLEISVIAASIALVHSLISILGFTDNSDPFNVYDFIGGYPAPAAAISIAFSLMATFLMRPKSDVAAAGAVAFILMVGSFGYCFYLWMNGFVSVDIAKIYALALISTIAIILGLGLRSSIRPRQSADLVE